MNRFPIAPKSFKRLKQGGIFLSFHKSTKVNGQDDGDPLVISGISGRFPHSRNFEEFKTNLYHGVDMVTEQERFISERLPRRARFMFDLDKFDAGFFGIIPKLADSMDPEQRMLLEVTFEAILDSGTNPEKLKGSKVGVFVGSAGGESNIHGLLHGSESNADGYIVIGQSNFITLHKPQNKFKKLTSVFSMFNIQRTCYFPGNVGIPLSHELFCRPQGSLA